MECHTIENMDKDRTLHVRAIGREISRQESGGGDISSVDLNESEAVITFEESDGELKFPFNDPFKFICYLSLRDVV